MPPAPLPAHLCNQAYRTNYRRNLLAQFFIAIAGLGLLIVVVANYILLPTGWQLPDPIVGSVSIAILVFIAVDFLASHRNYTLMCPGDPWGTQ